MVNLCRQVLGRIGSPKDMESLGTAQIQLKSGIKVLAN